MRMSAAMAISSPPPTQCPLIAAITSFGRVLQAQQHFVGVQAEVILERRVDAGQHLDVRASGEKLVARTGEHDDVNVVVHACFQDGLVELTVHFIGVGVGGRIEHLDHRDAAIGAVVDQLLRAFARCRLQCSSHVPNSFSQWLNLNLVRCRFLFLRLFLRVA